MKRYLALFSAFLFLAASCATAPIKYGSTVSPTGGGGGGGAPSGAAGGSLGGSYPNPTVIGSSFLQQPAMFVGSGAVKTISNVATSGAINSPPGVLNGDQEVVYISLNNATSGTFVPPAGWAAIASCATAGNAVQIIAFSHTASSEGGTIAAFTWTTNATGHAWASAYRNVTIDVCAANNAAAATTFTTSGITAATTGDLVVVAAGQETGGGWITSTTAPTGGALNDFYNVSNTTFSEAEFSRPIASTVVAGFGLTSGVSAAWAGVQLGLAYAASTTAGPQGALTYNQLEPYLSGLLLGNGINVVGKGYGLILPSTGATTGGIGGYDTNGVVKSVLSNDAGALYLGDISANNNSGTAVTVSGSFNASSFGAISASSNNITTTTGNHQCTTCQIGTTGGGILSTTGGAAPTVTCSGGSTGTSVTAGSTNNRGSIVSSSSASTNCTITWSAAAAWPQAPFCSFFDAGASITPTGYSTGACGTATCIVDFASTTSKTIGYICL